MCDAERCQRIEDRVDDGLRRGHAAGLAGTLDAERVHRGRQLGEGNVERRQVVRARQGIVRKRAAQQLARLPLVNRVFEQRPVLFARGRGCPAMARAP